MENKASCEYCIHCCFNDWFYCEAFGKVLNVSERSIRSLRRCEKFEECELSVITMEEKKKKKKKEVPEWLKLDCTIS